MRNWKIIFIFSLFALVAAIVVWKLYLLQIEKGEYYQVLALGQQVSFEETVSKRGDIFFSDGTPLAQLKKEVVVYIFPTKIPAADFEKTATCLAGVFGDKKENWLSVLAEGKILKKKLSDQETEKMKASQCQGSQIEEGLARFYPQGVSVSNVLGFVNDEGQGQYGVEGYYDQLLKGKGILSGKTGGSFGYLSLFFSLDNANVDEPGSSLQLTLDLHIQYLAEKALQQAKENWDIDAGQIIVQEPSTGKIMALATFPNFNPNDYSQVENLEAFLNSAVQKTFEPGSVFKPVIMAAGLEENLVTPDTEYEDKGFIDLGGPTIYNYNKKTWGKQTMTNVLENSINTGMIFVEQKLGKDNFMRYVQKFGLLEKTGLDVQGEVFSSNETLRHGYPRDFAVASFGQGIEITPIQLVKAFSAIANNGKLMKPYLVEKIIDGRGKEKMVLPEAGRQVISSKTAQELTSMLVKVVTNGSAKRAQIKGYSIAGKTGTAQVAEKGGGYSETKTVQSFISFFPASNPKAIVLVKLDNPKGLTDASRCAVPLARDIIKGILDLWQIPPDIAEVPQGG